MKKLISFFLFCIPLLLFVACSKEATEDINYYNTEADSERRISNPTNLNIKEKIEDIRTNNDPTSFANISSLTDCPVDPETYEDCEVTFKIICVNDCGLNIMESGELFLNFEYHHFCESAADHDCFEKNTFNNIAPTSNRLRIGQEYSLNRRVFKSKECNDYPLIIWGEGWTGGSFDQTAQGITIYLEINGAKYYEIPVWTIPQCDSIYWTEISNADDLIYGVGIDLDDNCVAQPRLDFVQDPCDNNSSTSF